MNRLLKTGFALGLLLLGASVNSQAAVVDFEGVPTGIGYNSYDLGGLNFAGSFFEAVWPDALAQGARNGTNIFINGYADEVITRTGGGSFTLNSFDLGLSFYTLSSDDVTITYNYAGGGSSSTTVTLDQTFTHFVVNQGPLSSVVFSAPLSTTQGYIALDNIVYSASSVPEVGSLGMIVGLGMTGAAFLRRRRAR